LIASFVWTDRCHSKDFEFETPPAMKALQSLETSPIDLATAYSLIGVQNPEFLAAQQRVLEATAIRQLAAVQLLPTINLGSSLDSHIGQLQQSNGNILNVSRQALFVGAGANAIAAGSVNIPGVVWNLNVTDAYFTYLISRQVEAQRSARVTTVNNDVQLRIAVAYLDLVRASAERSILYQSRQDIAEVARVTSVFARTGEGLQANADRAATELKSRDCDYIEAEGKIVRASANLAMLVGLDTAIRLIPTDRWAVPHPIVPEPIPLQELLAIAALQRPELAEKRAEVAQTLFALRAAKMLPFSPNVFAGFSAGAFGGGSNLANAPVGSSAFGSGQQRFGNFDSRGDLDVVLYWSLRNLGVGNKAQILASESRVRQSQLQQLSVFDQVRSEVAAASAKVHARFQQLETAEEAIKEAKIAFQQDLERTRNNEGLPIEVLDSQNLLVRSRMALLNSIIGYNIAQFQLYQSLGNPQAELLVRPVQERDVEVIPLEPDEKKQQ
jgi:outer membrane protein TolC